MGTLTPTTNEAPAIGRRSAGFIFPLVGLGSVETRLTEYRHLTGGGFFCPPKLEGKMSHATVALKQIIQTIKEGGSIEQIAAIAIAGLYPFDGIDYDSMIADLNASVWKGEPNVR